MENPISKLTVHNFRSEVKKLTQPFKEKIEEVSNHFKNKYLEYKNNVLGKKSIQIDSPIHHHRVKTASLASEISNQPEINQLLKDDSIIMKPDVIKNYELREWNSSKQRGFPNLDSINKYYNQIFFKKKIKTKNRRVCYDFKVDEKQMLIKIFEQIKSEENYVSFSNIINFFSNCKLFYLCYNVKPSKLEDLLKQSAHQYNDKLNLVQFLHIFFLDRPNVLSYQNKDQKFVNKRCVLTQDNWKQLKNIFSTLDTFGNETIYMAPFIYKIKNNHSNRALINEAAIEYPQINRTIPIKKVIFNLENRFNLEEKIQWKDIQDIFHNFVYREEPTIDIIYKKMIEKGEISRFTNYFMLQPEIIQQIKRIYYRCPKYCQYFVKTKFIYSQIIQSNIIKNQLKQAIVRIVKIGVKTHYITLQDQLRLISNQKHQYIDLDQLLEYFSIKGPINTTAEIQIQWNSEESSDEENQLKVQSLWKAKSQQKSKVDYKKQVKTVYKSHKHRTICDQFKLKTKTGQTIMERKTRQMRQKKIQQEEMELKKKFKANPIPVDLNPQRYKQYLKKMEEQKQYKKEQFLKKKQQQNKVYQYLKTNTSLFAKKQKVREQKGQVYTFTSKPLPWFVTQVYMLDKINESKMLRRKKIQIQTKFKIIKQWKKLPDALKQFSQPSQCSETKQNLTINCQERKTKQVPNFKELQYKFAQSLNKKKQEFKPTKPETFNLSVPKVDRKKQRIQTELIKSNSTHKTLKASYLLRKNSLKSYASQPRYAIPTTLKHQQLVNFTHEKLNNQLKEMQRTLNQQRSRIRKQRNFANYMRSKLNRSLKKSSSLHQMVKSKKKNLQDLWKQLKKDNEEELCRMYSNVMSRPFLFESKVAQRENRISLPIEQPENVFQPLKKKCRNQIGKGQHKISKHVHQSPLKQIEADINDSSPYKKQSPQHLPYQFEQQTPNVLNQSF